MICFHSLSWHGRTWGSHPPRSMDPRGTQHRRRRKSCGEVNRCSMTLFSPQFWRHDKASPIRRRLWRLSETRHSSLQSRTQVSLVQILIKMNPTRSTDCVAESRSWMSKTKRKKHAAAFLPKDFFHFGVRIFSLSPLNANFINHRIYERFVPRRQCLIQFLSSGV